MTNLTQDLRQAVEDIKTAILQGQYEASKGVNRILLAVHTKGSDPTVCF